MIKELFLKQFPEYSTDNFEITVNHSRRFSDTGGDIIVKKECTNFPGYYNYTYYWYEKDKQGNVTFEKEEVYNNIKVEISLRDSLVKTVYYKRKNEFIDFDDPESFDDDEDFDIIKEYKKKFESEIRKELAEKILSGEIELHFFDADSDCWECPPSKIKNRIINL